MGYKAREGLGRNRGGPATRNLVPVTIAAIVLLTIGGFQAFRYFTAPQRVLGANVLKCPAYEVNWQLTSDGKYRITGCGRGLTAACDARKCAEATETGF